MSIPAMLLFACGNNNNEQAEKARQDSISAAEADSMLRAEVAADSLRNSADSSAMDSTKVK